MVDNKIIEIKNVFKSFDSQVILDDLNLYIKEGEFVTILGPSGCGKTTTLRLIAGFDTPTSGQILLNGEDITNIPPYERPINTVFQRYALFPHLDVYDNVAFGLKLKKIPYEVTDKKGNKKTKYRKLTEEEIDAKVMKALDIVDLEDFESRNISTLSGGQQQRVAIARAIVNEPKILLLDEPLGALDLKMRKDMQLELKDMHKKLGITFIYVTHDQEEALTMSDTIVVMKDGIIQQIGTPTDIYNEPLNAFVADFIGESNIYNGTYLGNQQVLFLNHRFECVDEKFEVNQKVDVVIRPEDIKIFESGKGMVDAMLISKVFKGVHYEYVLMVGNNEVLVHSTINYEIGNMMSISVDPFDIQIMEKDYTENEFVAYIDNNNKLKFLNTTLDCDVTSLIPQTTLNDDGYLVDKQGKLYDLVNANVKIKIGINDIELSDDIESCDITGEIVSSIYKGDHYQVIARTEEDEDFVIDTEWTWNEGDTVGIILKPEVIKMKLVHEAKDYEKI